MGYTHHEGVSITNEGLAYGAKGKEIQLIDGFGNFYFWNINKPFEIIC